MNPGFFKKLFGKREENSSRMLWIYSQCDKYGEKLEPLSESTITFLLLIKMMDRPTY